MITKNEILQTLQDSTNWNIRVDEWKRVMRTMWAYVVDTKGIPSLTYMTQDQKEGLLGLLPATAEKFEFVNEETYELHTFFLRGSGMNRVKFPVIRTLVYDREAKQIETRNFHGWIYDGIVKNKVKFSSQIAQAREMYNMLGATEEEVMTRMATDVSTFIHDPQEFTSDVQIIWRKVPGTNRLEFEAVVSKNGQPVVPQRTLWEVWPNKALPGLPDIADNRNASSQFPHRNKFYLTTDLRDREAYPIMSAGKIRVRVQCDLFESDGDRVPVMKEEVIDITGQLPVYNYFG